MAGALSDIRQWTLSYPKTGWEYKMAKSAKDRMAEMRVRQKELGRNSRQLWLTPFEENELKVLLEILRSGSEVRDPQADDS